MIPEKGFANEADETGAARAGKIENPRRIDAPAVRRFSWKDTNMAGIVARLIALAVIVAGFVLEWSGYENRDLTGVMISGGLAVMIVLAFHHMWRTRGKLSRRDE